MGIFDGLRKIQVPTSKQLIEIPGKLKTETKNTEINKINIRYFDRYFKKCTKVRGTISHDTSIPIVYFNTPQRLAGIIFDDCTYIDEENQLWIDFAEDYPFGLNYNSELIQILKMQYYNDFSENKICTIACSEDAFKAYLIPVLINRIPREVIKIDTRQRMKLIDENYLKNKIEITQNLIRQFGDIQMLTRVGKKDNSFILTGVLLGGSIGIIIGIFIAVAFIK